MDLRIQNFVSSVFLISIAYVFYTKTPYFINYFAGVHTYQVLTMQWNTSNFEIFWWIYLSYISGLFILYFFSKQATAAKSVLFFRGIARIIFSPITSFESGIPKNEKLSLLIMAVKLFYAPLMIAWLADHLASLSSHISYVLLHTAEISAGFHIFFQNHLFWALFQAILFFDVFFFTIGYLLEHPFLKNTIISVEPTLFGWAVTLLCYPPFNNITNWIFPWQSSDIVITSSTTLLIIANAGILLLMGLYSWASFALGFKASNLTHRGIVNSGPYKYIRHPAYVCKNLAWWIGGTPVLIASATQGLSSFFFVLLCLTAWSTLYFLRALTEERHLRSVNSEYDTYMKQVPYRFIPKIV